MEDEYKKFWNNVEEDISLVYTSFADVGVVGMLGGVAYSVYGSLSGNQKAITDGSNLNFVSLLFTVNVFLARGLNNLAKKALQKKSDLEKKLDD